MSITSFDVAEAGWGDAPVAVHFTWRVTSTTGKPLRCLLDVEGDGNFDVELPNCDADTKATPIDALPAHTYTTRGEHKPKLLVSDGTATVEATQSIYANGLDFAPITKFPEKMPGFVKAEATPNTKVILTFASEAQLPNIEPGDILWGTLVGGYLLKVASVSKVGATLTVDGHQAVLQEAITNGFFGASDVAFPMNDVRCAGAGCEGLQTEVLEPRLPFPVDGGGLRTRTLGSTRSGFELAETVSFGLKMKLPSPSEYLEHSIWVGFQIKKFKLEIGFASLKAFEIDAVPGFQYEFEVKAALELPEYEFPRLTFPPVVLGVFPITPVFAPRLEASIKYKLGFSAGLNVPWHATYDLENGSRSTATTEPSARMLETIDPFSGASAVEAEAKLVLRLEALFFGGAGPYFAPTIAVKGEYARKSVSIGDLPCKGEFETCLTFKIVGGGQAGLAAPWLSALGSDSIDEKINALKKEYEFVEYPFYKHCDSDKLECDAGVGGEDAGFDANAPSDAGSTGDADADADAGPPKEICDGKDNDGDFITDEHCPDILTHSVTDGVSTRYGYTTGPGVSGAQSWNRICAFPTAIVGICGRVEGDKVIGIGARCGPITLGKDTTVTPYDYDLVINKNVGCPIAAINTGGTDFDYDCPSNTAVDRIVGRLGSGADARLEQIQVQCVQFVPVQDSSGVWTLVKQVQPASPVYGTGTTGTLFDWTPPQPPNGYHSFLFSFDGLFTTGGPTL
ncbi:MAG: hypothetical protein U0270_36350, partial [Labilithrix sp.]